MSTHYFDTRPAYLRAPPEINTDKATAVVFNTNELLYLIIDAVPREHRTPLLRVSKAWQAAIVKFGNVLKPSDYERRRLHGVPQPGLPLYRCVIPFKFHQAIFSHISYPGHPSTGVTNSYTTMTPQPYWDAADLARVEHEFVTYPPITELALCGDSGHFASLQVSGGIRVGHLLKRLPALSQKSSSHLYETWAVFGRPPLTDAGADFGSMALMSRN